MTRDHSRRGRPLMADLLIAAALMLIVLSAAAASRVILADRRGEDVYTGLSEMLGSMPDICLRRQPEEDGSGHEGAGYHLMPEEGFDAEPYIQALRAFAGTSPDCAGWIYIPGTPISYPIARCSPERGPDHWLTHLFTGEENRMGSIFLDERCPDIGSTDNTVIYGHNLRNGSMFRALGSYLSDDTFYEAHPAFYLVTSDDLYLCRIFSAAEEYTSSPLYNTDLPTEGMRQSFVSLAEAENDVNTRIARPQGRRFATLSTCSYGSGGDRLVVIGELISLKKIN